MIRRSLVWAFVLALGMLGLGTVHAQEFAPYEQSEFPNWALELRRAEIIAVGAFPVVAILTNFSYQLGRFAVRSIDAGEVAGEYAPALFSAGGTAPYSQRELRGLLIANVTLSAVVATIDWVLGRREQLDAP